MMFKIPKKIFFMPLKNIAKRMLRKFMELLEIVSALWLI